MSDTASALRATSDALLADLEQLEALEQQKRELEPGDPQVLDLAAAVEQIARRVLGETVRQRELSAVADELVKEGSARAPSRPIEETPREIHQILADWRAAERRVRESEPGSAPARAAEADVEQYREEYRAAHAAARQRR